MRLSLRLALCLLLGVLADGWSSGSILQPAFAQLDALQPMFHLRPERNWQNDPNGMFYWEGSYHYFFQYNPSGAVWGNMSWYHAISPDLVHWYPLPVALSPDQEYDSQGVFSGSTTMLNGVPTIFYTCVGSDNIQRQCVATPSDLSDPDLTVWTKSPANPLIGPSNSSSPGPFGRDPTSGWIDAASGKIMFAYGTGSGEVGTGDQGSAVIFASNVSGAVDQGWTQVSTVHSNSYAVNPRFWECPDIYAVNVVPVRSLGDSSSIGIEQSVPSGPKRDDASAPTPAILKASMNFLDFMAVGTLDTNTYQWVPGCASPTPGEVCTFGQGRNDVGEYSQLVDGGVWYASKSFRDEGVSPSRQILYGWIGEEDDRAVTRGWSGTQSLGRVVWPSSTGNRVCQSPLPELKALRMTPGSKVRGLGVSGPAIPASGASFIPLSYTFSFGGNQQEILASFSVPVFDDGSLAIRNFGLAVLATADGTAQTQVGIYSRGDAEFMKGWDLPGMDYSLASASVAAQGPEACAAACQGVAGTCKSWTWVPPAAASGAAAYCTLKSGVPLPVWSTNPALVSGVNIPSVSDPVNYLGHCATSGSGPSSTEYCAERAQPSMAWIYVNRSLSSSYVNASHGISSAPFLLDPCVDLAPASANGVNAWSVSLRIFIDHSIIEVFESGARAVVTARVYSDDPASATNLALYEYPDEAAANQPPVMVDWITAWKMASVYA